MADLPEIPDFPPHPFAIPYNPELAGHFAYDEYGDFVEWKNYAGHPMPKWEDLPEKIRGAWIAASRKVMRLSMGTMCPKCKKKPACINDHDDGMGDPVCCDCYESGLPEEPVV